MKRGDTVNVAIRPEKLSVSRQQPQGDNVFLGTVKFVDYFGSLIKYFVELETGLQLIAENQISIQDSIAGEKGLPQVGTGALLFHPTRSIANEN